jgi:hypothetical protein
VTRGLAQTADLWRDIGVAYSWVHRASHLLGNEEGRDVYELRRVYRGLLGEMSANRSCAGSLSVAISHFLRVTRSYWPGLFACYECPDIPHTNNDLEHCFASARYHERRSTGRKAASPAMVVRGRLRLVAAVSACGRAYNASDLCPVDLREWRQLRGELERRHELRREQLRFRRDPDASLARLETQLLKESLPP